MQEHEIIDISINIENIRERIYFIRGRKVMIDRDLAVLYGVETMRLNEAVKRNVDRFPEDFMFQLTPHEMQNWISQFAISNSSLKTSLRKPPLVFTEQGIAMLSSVLNSKRAIQVNIQIIRIFTKLRDMIDAYKELRERVEEMEKKNETNFTAIFEAIRLLIKDDNEPKQQIGYRTE